MIHCEADIPCNSAVVAKELVVVSQYSSTANNLLISLQHLVAV